MLDKIDELSELYGVSDIEVVQALRIAVQHSVNIKPNQEVDDFMKDGKLLFCIRSYSKKDNSMGHDGGADVEEKIIDITKAPAIYEKILRRFHSEIEDISLDNQYKRINNYIKNTDRILNCEITKVTKQGVFVKTPYGNAYCSRRHFVKKEEDSGLYKKGHTLRFYVLNAKIYEKKLHINLSRNHIALTKSIVSGIFSDFSLIYSVKRKPGFFTEIVLNKKPEPAMIKRLKYLVGGEKIIYHVK